MFSQRIIEKIFIVFSLLFFSGAGSYFIAPTNPLYLIVQVIANSIQIVTIFLIVIRWKKIVSFVVKEKLLWILVGLAVASILWSETQFITTLFHDQGPGAGVIPFIRVTLFSVYFAACYGLKEQMRLLTWTFGLAVLFSVVVALVLPHYGVTGSMIMLAEDARHVGAWRGLYAHKNILGIIMVLSAMVFRLVDIHHKYRWLAWSGFSLSVTLVLLSTSKTALVNLLTFVALIPLYKALRWNYNLAVPFFIAVIVVGGGVTAWFLENAATILGALGRDLTFTGRTDIWVAVINKIWERPWLGYGYNTFWLGVTDGSIELWGTNSLLKPAHAHNGFLDLSLDVGLLGLSLFAFSYVKVCWQAVKYLRFNKAPGGIIPIAYLLFMLQFNLTEPSLMREDIYWILYVSLTLSLQNFISLAKHDAFWQQKVEKETLEPIG